MIVEVQWLHWHMRRRFRRNKGCIFERNAALIEISLMGQTGAAASQVGKAEVPMMSYDIGLWGIYNLLVKLIRSAMSTSVLLQVDMTNTFGAMFIGAILAAM